MLSFMSDNVLNETQLPSSIMRCQRLPTCFAIAIGFPIFADSIV